jgi:hypothetical protein
MFREPPPSVVVSLCAARAERENRRLWIAGRKAADSDSWRYYTKADRPNPKPLLYDYDGDAA